MNLKKLFKLLAFFLLLATNIAQSAGLDLVKFDENFVWFKHKENNQYPFKDNPWFDRSKEPIQSDAKHFMILPKALRSYLGFEDGKDVIRIPRVDYLIAQLKSIGVDAFYPVDGEIDIITYLEEGANWRFPLARFKPESYEYFCHDMFVHMIGVLVTPKIVREEIGIFLIKALEKAASYLPEGKTFAEVPGSDYNKWQLQKYGENCLDSFSHSMLREYKFSDRSFDKRNRERFAAYIGGAIAGLSLPSIASRPEFIHSTQPWIVGELYAPHGPIHSRGFRTFFLDPYTFDLVLQKDPQAPFPESYGRYPLDTYYEVPLGAYNGIQIANFKRGGLYYSDVYGLKFTDPVYYDRATSYTEKRREAKFSRSSFNLNDFDAEELFLEGVFSQAKNNDTGYIGPIIFTDFYKAGPTHVWTERGTVLLRPDADFSFVKVGSDRTRRAKPKPKQKSYKEEDTVFNSLVHSLDKLEVLAAEKLETEVLAAEKLATQEEISDAQVDVSKQTSPERNEC